MLGGGLMPGALTVVAGATGIGKTQLGIHFAHQGASSEGRRGLIFDMASRGDGQNHLEYGERMIGWRPKACDIDQIAQAEKVFAPDFDPGEYLRIFNYSSRRVSRRDLDWDDWRLWQSELQQKLTAAIAFLYGGFVRGARRVVVDGMEPVQKASESIQVQLFDYIYHQIIRKDHDWVARDLFRQNFRERAAEMERHAYDHREISCLLLHTTRETMLEALIAKPIEEGDSLANANTIILMGKTMQEGRVGRGLFVAKHRGSPCDERIAPFTIDNSGLVFG